MKRRIALSLTLFLFSIPLLLRSQEVTSQFGIKAGLNLATMTNNASQDLGLFEYTYGRFIPVGVFWNRYFNSNWGIGLELQYNPRGGENSIDLNNTVVVEDYKIRLDYIALPITAKFRHNNFGLEAGAEVSFLTNVGTNNEAVINRSMANHVWNRDFDFGIIGGISYNINRVLLNFRYGIGFNSLVDITFTDVNGEPIRNTTLQNRYFQFTLGYSLFERRI